MSSPIRALSPGSSLASYDFFSHSSSRAISSGESDDGSYGSVSDDASSDDDVLLSFSDLSAADFLSQRGALTPAVFSDDEFVLMSRPRSPDSDDLTSSFSALSLSQASLGPSHHRRAGSGSSSKTDNAANAKRRTRKRRTTVQTPGNPVATTDASRTKIQSSASPESPKHHSPSKARRKARRAAARAAVQSPSPSSAIVAGLGDRPIVDDVSEVGSESPYIHPELYQTAQRYVSSVPLLTLQRSRTCPSLLSSKHSSSNLGSTPHLRRADTQRGVPVAPELDARRKALLKSQVFLNIRDYLAVRSQGIDALRSVMHPSRTALLREIRAGKRAPVKSVKESGLDVFLVTCYR